MIGLLLGLSLLAQPGPTATATTTTTAGPWPDGAGERVVRVPLAADGGISLADLVQTLAVANGVGLAGDLARVDLPLTDRSRDLTLRYLSASLGPGVRVAVASGTLVVTISPEPANAPGDPSWSRRLGGLAAKTRAEADRRARYGFRARASYRPHDPARPTVCLLHGLNSTSAVFKHLAPALEGLGYGVVVHDFPYNRDLDDLSSDFSRDWVRSRREWGDDAPWIIVAHSMGGLLARSLVESAPPTEAVGVSALILIAPPNHGSHLAHGQTLLQTVQALQSVRGERRTEPLALLGDGLGAAADDLTPGSAFLQVLNARPRRAGVLYRVLAGDSAYLDAQARRRVEAQLTRANLLGGLGRLVTAGLAGPLDEITDGLGDGCVGVASARLDGVDRFEVAHLNHLELIRAPLLFPEPGPIASLPILEAWLREATAAPGVAPNPPPTPGR